MTDEEAPIEVLSTRWDVWDEYVKILEKSGYTTIWYPQCKAFDSGALDETGNFLFISSPGSGKTLIAEVVLIESFLRSAKSGIYLVPYNELANEIYEELKERMESPEIGLRISKSTLTDENLSELKQSNIMIMTYEKFDYHLRNHPELISELGAVIVDEFHMLADENRGAKLELIIAQLLYKYPDIRIIGLTAVIPNGDELSAWMDAKFCDTSDWRRNPLYEGVYDHHSKTINFYDHSGNFHHQESTGDHDSSPTYNLAFDYIKKGIDEREFPQMLIFASKRKDTRKFATGLQNCFGDQLDGGTCIEPYDLEKIATDLENLEGSDTKTLRELIEAVKKGVAFHNAGLGYNVKRIIMDALKNRKLLIMISTTTLSAGVNLPVKRVIISAPRIGGRGDFGKDLTVAEYKNLAGRAGRPKYTNEPGECVIVSPTPAYTQTYLRKYILSKPEKVESKIDLSKDYGSLLNLLRDYPTIDELLKVMAKTLYGYKELNLKNLSLSIEMGVKVLEKWGFCTKEGELFTLTELGESVSKQIINPFSAFIILKNLRKYQDSDIDYELVKKILLTVCGTPEFDEGNRFWMKGRLVYRVRDELKKELELNHFSSEEMNKVILTTVIIQKWISEKSYSEIFETKGLDSEYWAHSDIKERIAPRFSTTIRAIQKILEESDTQLFDKFGELLEKLEIMTLYGISEEHVDFVQKGIAFDRNMIRFLVGNRIDHPEDILSADIRGLSQISGRDTALKLKKRAILNMLEGAKKEKELILLEAYEKGVEVSLIENLFNTSGNNFWTAVRNILSFMDDIFEVHPHPERSDSIPEADIYLKDENGDLLKTEEGGILKICIECKSTRDLNRSVSTSTALEILKKCPEGQYTYRIVVGTPNFVDNAEEEAEKHRILLIPVTTFVRIFLLKQEDKIDVEIIKNIFAHTGELTTEKLFEIIPKH